MQQITITYEGVEEQVILEFQGSFSTLNLPLGEILIKENRAQFKCGENYLIGRIVKLPKALYIFKHNHDEESNKLIISGKITKKIIFDEEPNHYMIDFE